MSDVVCLIPARGGSKRIPRKNLAMCAGKPLIQWTIERALEADVGPVWVSTDDDEIAELASSQRVCVNRRGPHSSDDNAPMSAAAAQFAMNTAGIINAGRLLLLQPTTPTRTAATIRSLVLSRRTAIDSYDYALATYHGRPCAVGWLAPLRNPAVFDSWHYVWEEGFVRETEVTWPETIDIDTPDDLRAAEALLKAGF